MIDLQQISYTKSIKIQNRVNPRLQQTIMSLKVSSEVFKWLQSIGISKQAKRNSDFLQLSEELSLKFFDGIYIAFIIRSELKELCNEEIHKKIESMKENSNPAIRLYNWNILVEVLKKLKITVESPEKNKIANFASQPIQKILKALLDLKIQSGGSSVHKRKGLQIQISEIQKKTLFEASNIMEYLVLSLSKHFKLSPQHTLNLFLDGNKYLSHLLVKGVKGNFHPICEFLKETADNVDFIVSNIFCVDEEENVNFFFNALKSCLISKDNEVIFSCVNLWVDFFHSYQMKGIPSSALVEWVKSQGINTLFFTVAKNSLFFDEAIEACYLYLKQDLFKYFQFSEKSMLWSTDQERLKFFGKIVNLSDQNLIRSWVSSDLCLEWYRYFVKNCKKMKEKEDLYQMNVIFESLWVLLGDKFEEEDSNSLNMAQPYMQFLKNMLNHANLTIFTAASLTAFNLIKRLGDLKNNNAPFLYKMLITVFSSLNASSNSASNLKNDPQKIAILCKNFETSIKEIKNLPGGPLTAPIVKHLNIAFSSKNGSTQHFPSLLGVCEILLKEKRLSEEESLQIVQILTKVGLNSIEYAEASLQIIFEYIQSMPDELADEYLQSNSRICLSQCYSLTKMITKTPKEIKKQVQTVKKDDSEQQHLLPHFQRIHSLKNCLSFLNRYLDIDDINLKNSLETILFHTYIKIKVELRKPQIAKWFFPILKRYYENDEELDQQISDYEKQAYPEGIEGSKIGNKITLLKSIKLGRSVELETVTSELKTLNPSVLKPSTYALRDLEQLKQKKEQIRTLEQIKEKKSSEQENRQRQIKNLLNQKRIIQFGSSGRVDFEYKSVYDFETMKEEEVVAGVPMIRLINIDREQESSYEEDLRSIMKKYKKLWRFLFFKYSTLGAKKTQQSDSGAANGSLKSEEKIHISELWKMLKEYDLFPQLKKEESQMIAKLINEGLKRKNDPQNLTYLGFQEYIVQICCYGYNNKGKGSERNYSHLPISRQIVLFIDQLKRNTQQKGGSVELFENPEDVYFKETDVIREFNSRLRHNPDYILPEGYKKYKQSVLDYDYHFHQMIEKQNSGSFGKNYIEVFEALSQILFEKLQINLIEPLTMKTQITLAKPALFQNLNEKMKDYKKGYLQPKQAVPEEKEKEVTLRKSLIVKREFHPHVNFSLGIKLGLSQLPAKDKTVGEEVAYWVNDMLKAIETNSAIVQNSAKSKISNSILQKRRAESFLKQKKAKEDQLQWKKRAQSVKLRLEKERKEKEEKNKIAKEQQLQERRKKKEKEEELLHQKLERFGKMKRALSARKQEEKYKRMEEEEKRKEAHEEYKERVEEYFQKKKEELIEMQEERKKKKEEADEEAQEKKEQKQKFIKQLYLDNLKREEEVLQKAEDLKDEYEEMWESEEIQGELKKHRTELIYLFNLLLKHEKSKISSTKYDEIGLNTLHYFALKFLLVPFLVEKNMLVKIFNYVIKEKEKKKAQGDEASGKDALDSGSPTGKVKSPGLNLTDFGQVLFLMAVKAKKLLNDIHRKRQKRLEKLYSFVNARKSETGNHFNVQDMSSSDSSDDDSSDESQEDEAVGLLGQYLFDVESVDQGTFSVVFVHLRLPKDKLGVEARYREAIEGKNLKPKKQLIDEMSTHLKTVKIEDLTSYVPEDQEKGENEAKGKGKQKKKKRKKSESSSQSDSSSGSSEGE